ncbi:MAG: thioredoxin TrxC [Sulfuricurvum sp.]|jgi:thioredoxin 2|uniref:thioredoxin TrxC n=1 Tax=Sulfuricurvum sp. IAE1 TaxID=2546102 RepID=UPI00165F12E7|nr:thioredoxin TrxC [Sulfuricurvum sp. IAE1]MDD3769117.1 thioredoxin TrxC [Sulfuricurvum sp.]MDX9966955.1 thioredoxin TrxC [Sulfuricurvum sp.]
MAKINVVCPHCGGVNAIPVKESYAKAACGHCKASLLDTKPLSVDAASFDRLLINDERLIVADFWAPWCGPCRSMAPSFEEAARAFALKAQFVKINTEEQQHLGARFGIRSIPTVIAFKNNRIVDQFSGARSAAEIIQWVRRHL